MNDIAEDILMHYGVKRRSGRYPWGSGENPYQHSGDFLSRVEELKANGWTETPENIRKEFGLSTGEYRMACKVAKHERRQLLVDEAKSLQSDGLNTSEIARKMGVNESTVRSWMNESVSERKNAAYQTADILKQMLENNEMLDVGAQVERELGISKQTLDEALFILEGEGYVRTGVGIPNVTNPGKQINTVVLARPGTEDRYIYQNMDKIAPVEQYYSPDGGDSYRKLQYPASLDSSRVGVRYAEEGGTLKDGVIEIRRGVEDLSLGNSHYAQVRILVDGTHYIKGMAVYSDDLPEGVDILVNSNKDKGTPLGKVLKPIKTEDPNNPFGAAIKANGQSLYLGEDGKEHLSPINKLKEEGDWDKMSKNLSSQFLSKQSIGLINRQLDLTYATHKAEYDEICSLENPTIRKKMLLDFADSCDSAVVTLKAAALPRQSTQVILPCDGISELEVYAPNYRNGERLALIRYPHGSIREIPIVKVNNNNPDAKRLYGTDMRDAIAIHPKVAERLSGADFDGDQVVCIPTHGSNGVKIINDKPFKNLIGFDTKRAYGTSEEVHNLYDKLKKEGYSEAKIVKQIKKETGVSLLTEQQKQKQMGMVSNLITDMTLKGAPANEIERAVKHSMVVIDAAKHKLDYKQSEKDCGIAELKAKWQTRVEEDGTVKVGGASTLLSRRKQTIEVNERQGSGIIDKETGEVVYKESGRKYYDKKTGELKEAKESVKLLNYVDDVHKLSSGTREEEAYADYANRMKALANTARKEAMSTPRLVYSPEAKKEYEDAVKSLNAKIEVAALNAPRERQAQILANSKVKAIMQENPSMEKGEVKKLKNRAIVEARDAVGAKGKETKIEITDHEWEAIQKGAITDSKLQQVMRYADSDKLKERALPKESNALSDAKIMKAQTMANSGYTRAEIADALGVSTSTISKVLAGE